MIFIYNMISKKSKLIEEANKKLLSEDYGGEHFELPPNHLAGMRVPKGGSSCANCLWLGDDKTTCKNKYFIQWNNDNNQLPAPADEYCSDFWQPKE
jgi:hypothetical protein